MEKKPKRVGRWTLNVGRWTLKLKSSQGLMSNACGLRSDSRGFSLLELMAVMLIMFIMMGLSTVAMRGVIRGAGLRGAMTTTRGAFIKARQYAMMNGRPTAVILEQEAGKPGRMRTIARYGKVAFVRSGVIVAESGLPWTSGEIAGAKVFNFEGDEGEFATTDDIKDSYTDFIVGVLSEGDDIALEVGTALELHSGMEFGFAHRVVTFETDGSSQGGTGIRVSEIGRDAGFTIDINGRTGKVTVTMD